MGEQERKSQTRVSKVSFTEPTSGSGKQKRKSQTRVSEVSFRDQIVGSSNDDVSSSPQSAGQSHRPLIFYDYNDLENKSESNFKSKLDNLKELMNLKQIYKIRTTPLRYIYKSRTSTSKTYTTVVHKEEEAKKYSEVGGLHAFIIEFGSNENIIIQASGQQLKTILSEIQIFKHLFKCYDSKIDYPKLSFRPILERNYILRDLIKYMDENNDENNDGKTVVEKFNEFIHQKDITYLISIYPED